MNISKWLGLLSAVGRYAIPPGGAIRQNNLQVKKPGQLTPRQGMALLSQNNAGGLLGLYRQALGQTFSDRVMGWRVLNDGSGAYSLEAMTGTALASASIFSTTVAPTNRPSFCEDRHGTLYAFFGSGIRPQIYRPGINTAAESCGIDAPTVAPGVTPAGDGFFIERVDVTSSGSSYYTPPTLTVTGGNPVRQAVVRAVVQGGSIVAVDVVDGGSDYKSLPTITISGEQVGTGFLAIGTIASSAPIYGFQDTATPSATTTNYVAGNAQGQQAQASQVQVAYATSASGTTQFVTASFDPAASPPAFTALIPLTPQNVPSATTATFGAIANTMTVADATGMAVGGELSISTTYFESNPVILNASGTTLTLDKNSKIAGTGVAVSLVPPSGAYVRVKFSALSSGYTLGNTTMAYQPTGSTEFTASGAGIAGSYKFRGERNSWFTDNDYYENTSNYTNSSVINANYNRDRFWGLLSNVSDGHTFGQNEVYSWQANVGSYYGNFFWPNFSAIGFKQLTGRENQFATEAQWTIADSYVGTQSSSPYLAFIDVYLQPMLKNDGTAYAVTADTRFPTVRIFLARCPEAWLCDDNLPTTTNPLYRHHNPRIGQYRVVNADDTDPTKTLAGATQQGSGLVYSAATANTAKRWWGQGFRDGIYLPQPIVDFRTGPSVLDSAVGLTATSIQIVDPGSQMERGTRFRLRFEQYDAYDYRYIGATYNTNWLYTANPNAVVPGDLPIAVSSRPRRQAFGAGSYMDLSFEALDLDTTVGSNLLPGAISGVPTVSITGSKWSSGQTGKVWLRQRTPPSTTYSNANDYTFTTTTLVAASATSRIGSVSILSGGQQYYKEPAILARDGGGYGLRVSSTVANGAVSSVVVIDGGSGYTSSPTLYTSVTPASVLPILRGTMRGAYRCAYRFADYRQTKVCSATIATTSGSKSATITVPSSFAGTIKPNYTITDAAGVPHMAKIASVAKASSTTYSITLSHAATATGAAISCTVRDMDMPVSYSDFSPITDVTADANGSGRASSMAWSLNGVTAPLRADYVEFFRTSGDQSLVFYRLSMYGYAAGGTITVYGTDTHSDEDLFDPDRNNYAALPVVLPNGALNAYRFGVPRSDMAVAVAFQDRLWYGVSTSGDSPNTVFFSELDEFEASPDVNEIPIQTNLRTTDYLTALVPFGSILMALQTSHAYVISYNTDPTTDSNVQLIAHRGCLCQHTWEIHDDVLYAVDERGVYTMTRSGEVQSLSEQVRDFFDEGGINLAYRRNFYLTIDHVEGVLRFFFTAAGVTSPYPHMALCLHIANQTWWTESWPNSLTCATRYRGAARDQVVYGSVDGNIYGTGGTRDVCYRDIASVAITSGGSGYVVPPTVTLSGDGRGAVCKALITNGVVTDVLVVEGGFGYGSFDGSNAFISSVAMTFSAPPAGTTATGTATARSPYVDSTVDSPQPRRTTVPWQFRTAPVELVTDASTRRGDAQQDRSVSVSYKPTGASKTLILREYYNNNDYPRHNVMRRDRGTGFVHEVTGARTTLDMSAQRSPRGLATGQAKAVFAARSLDDIASSDRDISFELSCDPVENNSADPDEAIIYSLEVRGVVDGG